MLRKFFAAALVAGSLVFFDQSASAGGPFMDVLFDNFCQGKPYAERTGCNGYLQYRIQRGRNRDKAFELCIWGCGEVLDSSTEISDCHKGCQEVNALDY
ncbi:MAG: hypothetical protein R6X11_07135 [Desulfonatronovibrio sp.]